MVKTLNKYIRIGYDYPTNIKKYKEHIQEKAQVKNTSKKGTTSRDMILMKERFQKADERKARSRKKFPSLEELRLKASNTQVDNDKTWEYIDEATAKKQDDIDPSRRATFWRIMPAKGLKEQVEKYFLICGKMNTRQQQRKIA